jgi:hypothetical protein
MNTQANQTPPTFWVVTSQDFIDKNPDFFKEGQGTPKGLIAAWPTEVIAKNTVSKKNNIIVELTSMHYRETRGIDQWALMPGALVVKIYPPTDPPKSLYTMFRYGQWSWSLPSWLSFSWR